MKYLFSNHPVWRGAAAALGCVAVLAASGCKASASVGTRAGGSAAAPAAGAANVAASVSDEAAIGSDTVTVVSKGSVYAVPDRAELRFGIRSQAAEASDAQKANGKSVDAVIQTLKDNGIQEENIQTTWYDVSPQYDWNTGNGDEIVGYNVSTSLTVKGVIIDNAGKLISACTDAGANEFNGVSYSCTNYDELYDQALQEAVASSREKAQTLAKAAGRSLGDVRMIAEGYQDTTYAYNMKSMGAMDSAGAATEEGSSATLLPGQAEITATVTVTYFLQPK